MIGFLLWYSCAQIERYSLSEECSTTDHKMRLNLRAGGFRAGSSMKAGGGGGLCYHCIFTLTLELGYDEVGMKD